MQVRWKPGCPAPGPRVAGAAGLSGADVGRKRPLFRFFAHLLRRQVDADVQFAQPVRVDRCRCLHHQILGSLGHREGDDLADVRLVREQHDDAVDPGGRATMRRGAELERAQHAAEARLHLFGPVAGDAEGVRHDARAGPKLFELRHKSDIQFRQQVKHHHGCVAKIQLEDVKPSSRQSPFIRFEQDKKLYRIALEIEDLSKGYDEQSLFSDMNLLAEVGERIAVIGPNGIGKTTLLRTLVNDFEPDSGKVKWSENASIGYYAQDHSADFSKDVSLFDWMSQWKKPSDDEQAIRAVLGRMLFSQDEIKKSVTKISGGEQGRMLFGKLMLQKPNVLVMDEPTNHLDMESIEALNLALENYPGTLVFVSHDREFVSSLATRVIELSATGIDNFNGTYEDYLRDMSSEREQVLNEAS